MPFRSVTRFVLPVLTLLLASAPETAGRAFAAPQVETSEAFGRPMSEAVRLVKAKKFAEALVKVNAAAPNAKTQAERLAIEQLRTAIYTGLGRTPDLIRSLEAQLAIGGLPSATTRSHRQ